MSYTAGSPSPASPSRSRSIWLVLRTRLVRRRVFWVAYAIIIVFQLISNGMLTYRHVVRYDRGRHPRAAHRGRTGRGPALRLLAGAADAELVGVVGPALQALERSSRVGAWRARVACHSAGPGDGEPAGERDRDAAVEHLVVGVLDGVEDAAVEDVRSADAVA